MARLSNTEIDKCKYDAKGLYMKNMSIQSISSIVGISVDSLKKWRKESNWDEEKDLYNVTPNSLRKMVLELIRDMKAGKVSKYSADEISKLASAFDKLGDKDKKTAYALSTFDDFVESLLEKAGKEKGLKQTDMLSFIKKLRDFQDEYINLLLIHD